MKQSKVFLNTVTLSGLFLRRQPLFLVTNKLLYLGGSLNMNERPQNLIIENGQLMGGPYKNFSGKGTQKNPEGKRNFCILIDPELVDTLNAEGWNVKFTKPRNEEFEPQPYLKVNVSYAFKPPVIKVITSKSRKVTNITERTIDMLDWAEIESVDVNINPSSKTYENGDGREIYSAYLQSMNVVIAEDPIANKYSEDEYEE